MGRIGFDPRYGFMPKSAPPSTHSAEEGITVQLLPLEVQPGSLTFSQVF
jgi:hypothetical protein